MLNYSTINTRPSARRGAIKGILGALFFAATFMLQAQAATPSPAMIEQLKKLPAAEQQALARQYGFDLNLILNASQPAQPLQNQQQNLQPGQMPNDEVSSTPKKPEPAKDELKRFGLSMFDPAFSTFAPTGIMPVPDSYILGPDDTLQLNLFGKINQQRQLVINRDGDVFIDELGSVNVAGLTFNQASRLLEQRVKNGLIGVDAAISMGQLRTINIFIAGEAKRPGNYSVPALTSITQALFIAGGVSDIGSLRDIRVNRQDKQVSRFDLYQLLLRGDASNDVHLQNGDVVFVSSLSALAEVHGKVRRPAIFELLPGDTLQTLIDMAGGVTEKGYERAVTLERFDANKTKTLMNIDLTTAQNQKLAAHAGDVLRILQTSNRPQNQITLAGAVVRPGFYAWENNMRVTDLIRSIWTDLHVSVDLDYALIIRQETINAPLRVLQFNLGKAVIQQDTRHNLVLQANDKLIVFHHGNESYQREQLNTRLRETLQQRLESPLEERWLLNTNLANDAFALITEETTAKATSAVAQMRIRDNISGTTPVVVNEPEPFTTEALKMRQDAELNQVITALMQQLYLDQTSLALTPHLTRQELLFPILQQLRSRARSGNNLQIVTVTGEVKVPGEYPLAEGAQAEELILAAGGLKDSANLARAELTRFNANTTTSNALKVEHIDVVLDDESSQSASIALNSRDTLNVFAIPDWNVRRVVEIRGEVTFPGSYPVQRGEKLSDVIKRAGGLTPAAFSQGAVFVRDQVKEAQAIQVRKLIEQLRADVASRALSAERASISPQDAVAMVRELEKQTTIGRLVIDLPQIVRGAPEADLDVEHGDILYIPRQNQVITVIGEVQHAGSHRFQADKGLDYYLSQAGGLRKRADGDRIYVIRADGSVYVPERSRWFNAANQQLAAGDTVIVPLDTEYRDSLSLWTQVTQILYQSAVALAAIASL